MRAATAIDLMTTEFEGSYRIIPTKIRPENSTNNNTGVTTALAIASTNAVVSERCLTIPNSVSKEGGRQATTSADAGPAAEAMARRGHVSNVEFDKRVHLFDFCVAGILHGVHTTRELSPADADVSLEIALAIWSLSPDAARAVTSHPLEN